MANVWEPVLPGIANTQWFLSDAGIAGFMQNTRYLGADFRDKYGDKWRTVNQISNELIADGVASSYVLGICWKHFKRYIEHRYNQVQPWETADLNPRSTQWKYEHPEIVDSWYPSWDDET